MITAEQSQSKLPAAVVDDVLAVADTRLVFGSWCLHVVFNGRAIADFVTLLAIGGTSLGHARAFYQYLVNHDFDYGHLENGRAAGEINGMAMLDAPPRSWADLMACILLVEKAVAAVSADMRSRADDKIRTLLRKTGQEAYFHGLYAEGWVNAFDDAEQADFAACLRERVVVARQWVACRDDGGTARVVFEDSIEEGVTGDYLKAEHGEIALPDGFDKRRRRQGVMPEKLYEIVRLKEL